jgi:phthalate 4,5-dioxygenase oxygenase subunit
LLTKEQNELLCRVGPGTLMGTLFRRYWLPIMHSWELVADGAPIRIRVLGEDLIAFRDTDGKVGLVGEHCPHRLAPLVIGRNEECGLRCLYHGWKFDVNGLCVDMPNEPESSGFRAKIKQTAYMLREEGEVVWAYLGDPATAPAFPIYRWAKVRPEQRITGKWIQEANWMQSLEGGIDTSHASFLHRRFDRPPAPGDTMAGLMWKDKAPRLELQETNYGFRYAAIRDASDTENYIRITPHIMPCSSYPPGGGRLWNCWVPRDDVSCWAWDINIREDRPWLPEEIERLKEFRGHNAFDPRTFQKFANADNLWLQNRDEMKTISWTGLRGLFVEDNAVQEGMGAIVDRTQEHLGRADQAIIDARQLYLDAAEALVNDGIEPPGVQSAETYEHITSYAFVQPKNADWKETEPLDPMFDPQGLQLIPVRA